MQLCLRILALCTFFLLLIACPAPEPTGECTNKDDCVSGQVCCKEKASDEKGMCKAEADCKSTCENGTACSGDSDCGAGEKCDGGCCTKATPATCQKHADCPDGNDCVPSGDEKKCVPCAQTCKSTLDCPTAGDACEGGCCRQPSCGSDDDCASRSGAPVCKKETGECVECLKNEECQKSDDQKICRNERCVKVDCTKDRHCLDSKKPTCNLQNYKCTERAVCKTHADCTDPQLNRCDPTADGGRGKCKKGSCIQCENDDECGISGDFCVGQDKGLKDGRRCLIACEDGNDCPAGFICSDALITNFKVCFPPSGYCEDPCSKVTCKDDERCVEGVCKPKPAPCVDCTKDGDKACEPGAQCLNYGAKGMFCGKKCDTAADCPKDPKRDWSCLNGQCLDGNQCQ